MSDVWFSVRHTMAAEAAAGPVRTLSREEIDALQRDGRITPMELITKDHAMTRVSVPPGRRTCGW